MKYLIIYAVIAVIFEAIYIYIEFKKGLNKLKQKPEYEHYKSFYKAIFSTASMMLLKSKIWNWYTITFVFIPLFIFVSPFLFPSSLFSLIKKVFGYKSKLENKADIEEKLSEEASIKAKEWMENEGDINPFINETIPEPQIEFEQIKILTYDEMFSIFDRVEKLKESIKNKENDLMGEIVKKEPQAFRTYTLKEILERDNLTEFRPEARKELLHVSNELRLIFEELK